MNHHQAFLQDILEKPDDDLPRLIYADWLDEHGDPDRAEFIRTQIELARLPKNHLGRLDLAERARQLLQRHEKAWVGRGYERARRWHFRRGFVHGVEVDLTVL